MHIIADARTTNERFEGVVLTAGCFDGVHLGHRQIVKALIEEARDIGGTPAVMTLDPHPRQFFSPENAPNILTDNARKHKLLEDLGVRLLYVLPFDRITAAMSREDFVASILVERCCAASVVVGHDFVFGREATGDFDFLEQVAPRHGFRVKQIPPLIIGGQRVSSTLIRERILQGEVENLQVYLGRRFSLSGPVLPGRGIGSTLGFPTANLDIGACVIPAHGVYAARAFVEGRSHIAAVNIGIAPTIRNEQTLVEAHLLDFDGVVSGKEMEIVFYKRLRTEKKFASREDLVNAIAADVRTVSQYFATDPDAGDPPMPG